MGPSLPRRRVLAVAALVSILRTSLAGAARFGRDAATLALRSQFVEYALDGRPAPLVHWQRSPYDLYRHSRFRERAGEPFTPRIPRLIANHPTMSGAVLAAVGMVGPPKAHRHDAETRRVVGQEMVRLLSPYADQLTCPVEHLVHVTRLLTFSGTHPHISDGQTLTPEQIVGTILDGVLREDHSC